MNLILPRPPVAGITKLRRSILSRQDDMPDATPIRARAMPICDDISDDDATNIRCVMASAVAMRPPAHIYRAAFYALKCPSPRKQNRHRRSTAWRREKAGGDFRMS